MPSTSGLLAGQRLTAAGLQAIAPLQAWKSSDTSRASTTTLTADPDLTFPVAASAVYRLDGLLGYTGDVTGSGGIQFAFTVPAGATLQWSAFYYATAVSAAGLNLAGTAGAGIAISAVTDGAVQLPVFVRGWLSVSTTPGTLALTWAQNASDANATVLKAGSHLTLMRMQ